MRGANEVAVADEATGVALSVAFTLWERGMHATAAHGGWVGLALLHVHGSDLEALTQALVQISVLLTGVFSRG